MRLLNLCVAGAAGGCRGLCLRDQVRVRRCAPSASPRCAATSSASATPSRRCAPNGATLENPARIQGLARRHLRLRPAEATQYDSLDRLPERPPTIVQPPPTDAIADTIEDLNPVTGSMPALMGQR